MRHLLYILSAWAVMLFCGFTGEAQQSSHKLTIKDAKIFDNNESLTYSINFKWGIIRGRIGEATISNYPLSGGQYFSQLLFRTVGLGDSFYRMRDTLETLYSAKQLPLRFEKRIDDKGYRFLDEMSMTYARNGVKVHVRAGKPNETPMDTTYVLQNSNKYEVLDLLSTLAFIRSFDIDNMRVGDKHRFIVVLGKDKVNGEVEVAEFERVRKHDGEEVPGVKLLLHIKDKNFTSTNSSIEAWITRDAEQLPVKIIGKLSVGRVECRLEDYFKKS